MCCSDGGGEAGGTLPVLSSFALSPKFRQLQLKFLEGLVACQVLSGVAGLALWGGREGREDGRTASH